MAAEDPNKVNGLLFPTIIVLRTMFCVNVLVHLLRDGIRDRIAVAIAHRRNECFYFRVDIVAVVVVVVITTHFTFENSV